MGGYTVYVQNFACPAYNGVKNSVVNSGDLKVLVTSGDPNSSTPNGQYLSNLQGDNTITGVIGSGQIWLKINDNVYTDNTGEYNVDITIKSGSKTAGMFSSMIMGLVNMIKDLLFVKNVSSQDWSVLGSQSTNSQIIGQNLIYTRLTCSGLSDKTHCFDYIKTLRAMLTLYIIFYSISFLFGLINPTQIDLVIRIIKIGVIITLTSDRSWSFFNDIFFKLFVDGGAQLINAINGNGTSSSNPFAFADTIMQYLLFDDKAIIRLLAILFTSTVGPIYFCLILYGAYVLLGEIFKAACAYIMSFVAIAILISLAPIFIPCILFSLTRHLFDNWIKFLVRYTLEPVLLLGGLGILSQLLLVALGQIFSFAVCWKCAFPITFGLPIPNFPSSLKVFCINFFQPWGYDNMGGGMGIKSTVLGMFTEILFFLIIISAIKKYCQFSKTLAMMLTGSVDAPAVSGGESAGGNIAHSISEGLKTPFGLDEKSKDRRSLANSKEENKAEAKIKEAKEGAQNNPAGKGGNNNAPVVARGGNNIPPVGGGGDND
jgi:type IV secretion system protein VirB6